MEEQLISFETAKLAKEKGFNIRSKPYRYGHNHELTLLEGINAPTQSLLQKWLREIHKIDVHVIPVRFTGHEEIAYYTFAVMSETPMKDYKYNTWEEALENALEKGLEEIK